MAVRRRRPTPKPAAAPTSRVHAVETLEQWETMLAKAAAAKKLLVVQFYKVRCCRWLVVVCAYFFWCE